ncbi:VOC family protein [Candidatus Kaiserbacteria bacterium]|nr:VOC family protein [Candidatus Kaiserbacteria bacterium]
MRIRELGHVVLYVTELKKVANFYRDILGFKEIARDAQTALFSSGRTHHELLLIEIGGVVRRHGIEPGLYHIGFKAADSAEEIKEVYAHLKKHGVTIVGTGDHGITHSIYILDPDGNELELYADVSDKWRENPKAILQPVRSLNLNTSS